MVASERLGMRTKLAFGVGAAAEAGCYIAFNTFNFLFYNNVLGLPGWMCGAAVTIALIADAIADPGIGFLSDSWRSRLGRRHPFLYAAPIPLAISVWCIYSPPEGLQGYPLFFWLTGFTLMFRQALSLYHVPHLALGAELSNDYHERSVVMSYNSIFQVIGGSSAFFFGWTWFASVEGGTGSRDAYAALGIATALAGAVIIFISAHFTRDQIPRLPQAPVGANRTTLRDFFVQSLDCLRNRNYSMLLLGFLCLGATIGTRETLNSYMTLFFWEFPGDKIRVFALASPPAYVLAFLVTAPLHRMLDKRATIIASAITLAVATAVPVPLRLLGLLPENGTSSLLAILLGFTALYYLGFAMLSISVLSALADIADEHELNTGRRQEGMFFAARTFFAQIASGLGHLIAGFAIDWIAFPTAAKPGQVQDGVLFQLGLIEGPLAAIPAIVAVLFYARFRITRERHAEIQRAIGQRHGSPAAVLERAVPSRATQVPASEPA
jgi:glycoside/pentoside/hexuronide:cation symporter, GPH family